MKQLIHDKTIQACICGRAPKAVMRRSALQRSWTWGISVAILWFAGVYVLSGFDATELLQQGGVLMVGVFLYATIRIPLETIKYAKKGHKLQCALRYAYYKTI